MAMTVRHNDGVQQSLFELNKNQNGLGKTLMRLSSGQKFYDANGNAASYSISEKMLEQIRSLFQDHQNIQNGSSMVKTAERGIDQIIQNLRTMKELAIDAANDSNTDEDRHTIQKEIDQRRDVINEIALYTQFNTKILLDGRYSGGIKTLTNGGGGLNTTVQNISDSFKAGNNARDGSSSTNCGYGAWQFEVDASFGWAGNGAFSVEMDFSEMQVTGSYPDALHGQGFTILCSGCMQYINVRFDASKTSNLSTYNSTVGVAEDGSKNYQAREFIIGVKNVRKGKDLAAAIFNGVSAVSSQIMGSYAKFNTTNDLLVDQNHNVRMRRDANGRVFLTKETHLEMQFLNGTIPNPLTVPLPEVEIEEKPFNPLWIQHGTRAGQRMNVYINDMRSKALGIDTAEVTTQEKATSAIGVIESAIEITLDEATSMGAYLQRFEYTGSNVTTMNENVQASESAIRDADMAKEMTEYMRYNLLSQSAQAMLAQANQNGEFTLNMLQ